MIMIEGPDQGGHMKLGRLSGLLDFETNNFQHFSTTFKKLMGIIPSVLKK